METVINAVTGVFFDEQSPESLINVLEKFEIMHAKFCATELIENSNITTQG